MSNRQSLSQQTGKIWVSIRKNCEIDLSLLNTYLNNYCNEFAYITHQKDIEPKTGQVEGIHYHFVANLKDKYKHDRLSTTLNHIVDTLKLDNSFGVNIEKYDSFEGCIQYLTHKNNSEKTQHSRNEIVTNIDKKEFDLYYNADLTNVFSFDLVYSKCLQSSSRLDYIRELWPYYSKDSTKQRAINDIWLMVKGVNK